MITLKRDRLNEFLKFRKWNQADLARALNYTEGRICQILRGDRSVSGTFMERLCNLTGDGLDQLFEHKKTSDTEGAAASEVPA